MFAIRAVHFRKVRDNMTNTPSKNHEENNAPCMYDAE